MDISIYTAVTNDGVEAHVFELPRGYALRLLDADAGQWLPASITFPTLDEAQAYADLCVR